MLWVSQNMKEFPEWINTKFIKYRIKQVENKSTNRLWNWDWPWKSTEINTPDKPINQPNPMNPQNGGKKRRNRKSSKK